MKLLVIGYYNNVNLGDESYKNIMGDFFPIDVLDFISSDKLLNVDHSHYDGIIVGGGDMINNYFNKSIKPFIKSFKGPKIAFSIGIPFPNLITKKYLGYFDHVFTRNYEDIRPIQKLIGSTRSHYIPDITLNYKPTHILPKSSSLKKCGVFLVGNLIRYPSIVKDISRLINKLSRTYNITLYCFDIKEDPQINIQVQKISIDLSIYKNNQNLNDRIKIDVTKYTQHDMINIMTQLDFAICMRYHSHIFCMIAGIPFLSISSTRKTRSLMRQAGLSNFQYEIPLDAYSNPIQTDYDLMNEKCQKILHDKSNFIQHINTFVYQSRYLLSHAHPSKFLKLSDNNEDIFNFINETNDYQNGARLISQHVLGYPDSPYVWGISEKLKDSNSLKDVIQENISYLINNGIKNIISHLFRYETSLPLYVDIHEYQSYKDAHRGGWYIACEELYKRNMHNYRGEPNGIICDMYLDRTFFWAKDYYKYRGIIPYTGPWSGFIHHTANKTYSNYNLINLFKIPEFIQSLHTCKALFTLSEPLSQILKQYLNRIAPHIQVFTFDHPILIPSNKFSMKAFKNNPTPMLINIGAWMRNPLSIYRVSSQFQKALLIGKDMNDYVPPPHFDIKIADNKYLSTALFHSCHPSHPCRDHSGHYPRWVQFLIEWLQSMKIKVSSYQNETLYLQPTRKFDKIKLTVQRMIQSVLTLNFHSNDEYDRLLTQNIVFIDLIDAAAVNTIIECIVRNTPIIVNKIPGTIYLLGSSYPLFYNNLDDVPSLLNESTIKISIKYLRSIDVSKYTIDSFIDKISNVIISLDS